MEYLPFESSIREFMWKINDELDRVSKELNKVADKSRSVKTPELDPIFMWKMGLQKLHAECSAAISKNIKYRSETRKN